MDKRKLTFTLWKAMTKLIQKYNPCNFHDGKCKRGYACCAACPYLTPFGCGTKCLTCALWFCEECHIEKYPLIHKAIFRVDATCEKYGIELKHRTPIPYRTKDNQWTTNQ